MTDPPRARNLGLDARNKKGGRGGGSKKNEIVEKSRDKISTSFDLLNGRENIGKRTFDEFSTKAVNLKRSVKRMERALRDITRCNLREIRPLFLFRERVCTMDRDRCTSVHNFPRVQYFFLFFSWQEDWNRIESFLDIRPLRKIELCSTDAQFLKN